MANSAPPEIDTGFKAAHAGTDSTPTATLIPGAPASAPASALSPSHTPSPKSNPNPNHNSNPTPSPPVVPSDTITVPETTPLPSSHWATPPEDDPDDDEDEDGGGGDEDEDDVDERDSAFGDAQSSTASLSASIFEYRTLHGRTYHSERGNALSWAPNDDRQIESMDINHHLLTKCLEDKLHLAPLSEDIQAALDIGTGTGIWAIDFADQYPSAEVVGTDVSPIQPSWIPPNLRFEIEDATDEWTFKPEAFDYVHIRYMFGTIPDWTRLYKEAYRVCKPGGWLEDYEASANMESDDGTVIPGSAIDQWGKIFWEAGKKMGRNFRILEEDIQVKAMEEAGFVDIKVWNFKAPIGDWPADVKKREIGQLAHWALSADLEGYILYACNKVLGWSREEVMIYLAHLRKEMRSSKIHAYYRQRVVYGRKPET